MPSRVRRFGPALLLLLCAVSAAAPGEDSFEDRIRQAARMPEVRAKFSIQFTGKLPFPGGHTPTVAEAEALRAALTGDERDAESQYKLGCAAKKLAKGKWTEEAEGHFRTSIDHYRKRARAGVTGPDFRISFAQALCEAEELDEAEAQLRAAAEGAPKDWRCWVALCCCLQYQAERSLFGRAFGALVGDAAESGSPVVETLSKTPPPERMARAVELLQEAQSCGDRAVEVGPRVADAYRARAGMPLTWMFVMVHQGAQKTEQGKIELLATFMRPCEDWLLAARLEPMNVQDLGKAMVWRMFCELMGGVEGLAGISDVGFLGNSWNRLSENARKYLLEGMAVLRDAARHRDPRIAAAALEYMGVLLAIKDEEEQGEKCLLESVALDPSRGHAWECLIGFRQRRERNAEVVAACEAWVKASPSPRNQLMLAKSYEVVGEFVKAEKQVRIVRDLVWEGSGAPALWDRERLDAELALANLLLRRGTDRAVLDEAKACLDLAMEGIKAQLLLFGGDPLHHLMATIGVYLALMGKPAFGEQFVRDALRRDPSLEYGRAVLQAMRGDRRPEIAAYPPSADAKVFADFEAGAYAGWTVEGRCFGKFPAMGRVCDQQPTSGEKGLFFVNTFHKDDGATGKATSAPFPIEKRFIHFLIGGGRHPGRCCLDLVVDGKVVRSATGRNSEEMLGAYWDVGDLKGKTGRLEIRDEETGGWGHILVDQVVFAAHPDLAGAHFPRDQYPRKVRPAEGTRRVLTILFDPHRPGHPAPEKKAIENLLFGERGSLRGWFAENSGGKFGVESAGVLGWYDAKKPAEHYWKTEKGQEEEIKEGDCWLRGVDERLTEAVRAADADFDFALCDGNGDGELTPDELAILIVIPHNEISLGVNRPLVGCAKHGDPVWADGVQVPAAVEWRTGERLTFGTPAKELSEFFLGAVDMNNWDSWEFGANSYSIMDWAGANGHMDPLLKLKLGWVAPVGVAESGAFDLGDVETRGEVLVLYDPARGLGEYFLVENRWRGTSYDAGTEGQGWGIPADGLAVWHVVEDPALLDRVEPPAGAYRQWEGRGMQLIRVNGGKPPDDKKTLLSIEGAKLSDTTAPAHLRWIDGTPSGFEVELASPPGPKAKVRVRVQR